MTALTGDHVLALLMEIAELRIRVANVEAEGQQIITDTEAERDQFGLRCEELKQQLAERNETVAQLHAHIADLERAGAPHGVA